MARVREDRAARAGVIRRVLGSLAGRPSITPAEIDAEIASHLAQRIEWLVARGYTPEPAMVEATRRFGDVARARERLVAEVGREGRRMNVRERMASVASDVGHAIRR